MAVNKVVVKYLDGGIAKGNTLDFHPTRDTFHLNVIETDAEVAGLGMWTVDISQLKAIFFVKDFAGRSEHEERKKITLDDDKIGLRKVAIEFQDGEILNALSVGFGRSRKGFFVNPVDPESNNIRIFVIWATAKHVEELDPRKRGDGIAFNKAVVKYLDGKILKGSILDFDQNADFFHLDAIETNEEGGTIGIREVDTPRLKAIFFVNDFAGKPGYKERNEFMPGDEKRGKKISIEFQDGEKLNALSMGFGRERRAFFVNPVDPESNNARILVISANVKDIEVVP